MQRLPRLGLRKLGLLPHTLSRGGGGAWLPNLRKLASAKASAQGVPTVAPVEERPVITAYQTTDAALAVVYAISFAGNRDKLYSGGGALVNYGGNAALYGSTVMAGANIGTGMYQQAVFHETETASANVEFRIFRQNTTRCRLLFRNAANQPWRYAHEGLITLNAGAASTCVKVTFGGVLPGRQIRLELAHYPAADTGTAAILNQIRVDAGSVCAAPSTRTAPCKVLVLGDSYVNGGDADFKMDGFALQMGWMNNWEVTNNGIGGTGLLATTGGTQPKLIDHIGDATLQDFDAFVVPVGTNDTPFTAPEISAATAALADALKQAKPTAPQFWATPWDLEAPAALSAGKAKVRDAMKSALTGRPGVWTWDPTGLAFTKKAPNNDHADTAGHLTLATGYSSFLAPILAAA